MTATAVAALAVFPLATVHAQAPAMRVAIRTVGDEDSVVVERIRGQTVELALQLAETDAGALATGPQAQITAGRRLAIERGAGVSLWFQHEALGRSGVDPTSNVSASSFARRTCPNPLAPVPR